MNSLVTVRRLPLLLSLVVLMGCVGELDTSFDPSAPTFTGDGGTSPDLLDEELRSERAARARARGEVEIPSRLVVMPRAGLPLQAFESMLAELGGHAQKVGQSDLYVVELDEGNGPEVIARLAHNPHIDLAEVDRSLEPDLAVNDPYLSSAWHLTKIGAPVAWDESQGAGVTIAILDSGVDGTHPDLAARMVPGWNFYDNNSNTADVYGHGTKVAGAAAAISDNGVGVASVAGQARIMPIRVTGTDGWATWSGIAQGIVYAADHGARVANVSFRGVTTHSGSRTAAQYMKDAGGLVIVSGGNTGVLEAYTVTNSMISVAATGSTDVRASWSSYGNYITLAAPGVGIWTTTRGGGYGAVSGTSFSSPVTAGVVALMMSANPDLRSTDIESLLFSTAVDLGTAGWDQYYGHGRVDAAAAVAAAIGAAPRGDTTPPTVAITSPTSGSTVSGLVPVSVNASDNVGVTRVELSVNGTTVAVDTSAPFAFSWDSAGTANGTASLVARAFDAAGNQTNSSTVSVNVSNNIPAPVTDTTPPTVRIVNPVAGSVSGAVSITVNASDNSGAAGISLSIYIDGAQRASGTGSTLSTSWNTRPRNVSAGNHTIRVVARDAAGNQSSAEVIVTVVK